MEVYDPIEILLVEDNKGDIQLTREAMKARNSVNRLHVVESGEDALDFLYKRKEYQNAVTPDIILLDFNLPGLSGHEVLKTIKNDEELKIIPVIVTSTSASRDDIIACYKSCASGYIVKPIDVDKFFRVIDSLENLWQEVMKLPTRLEVG